MLWHEGETRRRTWGDWLAVVLLIVVLAAALSGVLCQAYFFVIRTAAESFPYLIR